jgi:hypothetical protein
MHGGESVGLKPDIIISMFHVSMPLKLKIVAKFVSINKMFAFLISTIIAFPNLNFGRQSLSEHDYAYAPPTESDQRAPCPGVNTLANHGYIHRNGLNVSNTELLDGFQLAYGLSPEATGIFLGGIANQKNEYGNLDLNRLREHNVLEHDASLVHSDAYFGPAWVVNQTLVLFLYITIG